MDRTPWNGLSLGVRCCRRWCLAVRVCGIWGMRINCWVRLWEGLRNWTRYICYSSSCIFAHIGSGILVQWTARFGSYFFKEACRGYIDVWVFWNAGDAEQVWERDRVSLWFGFSFLKVSGVDEELWWLCADCSRSSRCSRHFTTSMSCEVGRI